MMIIFGNIVCMYAAIGHNDRSASNEEGKGMQGGEERKAPPHLIKNSKLPLLDVLLKI